MAIFNSYVDITRGYLFTTSASVSTAMDATVVRQKLIFHALVRQLEAEVVSEEALAQYLSLGGSDNLELLRELLMCFFGD